MLRRKKPKVRPMPRLGLEGPPPRRSPWAMPRWVEAGKRWFDRRVAGPAWRRIVRPVLWFLWAWPLLPLRLAWSVLGWLLRPIEGMLRLFAEWLERHALTRFLQALTTFGIISGVMLFALDMEDKTDDRITRAWQLVTTPAPGNSGKRAALEYLNSDPWWNPFKEKVSLFGLDLSSKRNTDRVDVRNINLSRANLWSANLSGAIIGDSDFTMSRMGYSNLDGASMDKSVFINSDLMRADLRHASLTDANFADANLWEASFVGANINRAIFIGSNLSGVSFVGVEGLTQGQLDLACVRDNYNNEAGKTPILPSNFKPPPRCPYKPWPYR